MAGADAPAFFLESEKGIFTSSLKKEQKKTAKSCSTNQHLGKSSTLEYQPIHQHSGHHLPPEPKLSLPLQVRLLQLHLKE